MQITVLCPSWHQCIRLPCFTFSCARITRCSDSIWDDWRALMGEFCSAAPRCRSFRTASGKWSSTWGVEAREEGAWERLIFHQAHQKAFRPPLHSPDRHTFIYIFASSHEDRWVQLLHTSLCLTDIYIYLTIQTYFTWHTRTQDANWGTLTHRPALHSLFHVCRAIPRYAPDISEFNCCSPRLEALIVM